MAVTQRWKHDYRENGVGGAFRLATTYNGVTTYGSWNTSCMKTSDWEFRNGYSIVGYHKLLRSGALLPFTYFHHAKGVGSNTGVRVYTSGAYSFAHQPYTLLPNGWQIDSDEMDFVPMPNPNDLVQEAASAISSISFDALTFLAELKDIRSLYFDITKKLLRMKFPKNWRELSNDYLSIRYGWRPVISDIQSLHKMLSNFDDRFRRCGKTRRASFSDSDTSVTSTVTDATYTTTTNRSWDVSLVGHVVADVNIPKMQFDLIQTAWELVPFSFVFDWFVSVGTMLSAYRFLRLSTNYQASYGWRVDMTKTVDEVGVNNLGRYTSFTHNKHAETTAYTEYRNPCRIPLSPHLTFKLDAFKILDLISLLVQRS